MVPRILPCVPLPAAGAPNKRRVRYFILSRGWRGASSVRRSGVFMFELDLLDFGERDHDFLGSAAVLDLQVKVISGDAADALADVFAPRGFDDEDHVFFGIATDNAEEAREPGFEETTVESELAAMEGGGRRQGRLGMRRLLSVREAECTGMLAAFGLHGIDGICGDDFSLR